MSAAEEVWEKPNQILDREEVRLMTLTKEGATMPIASTKGA
jgi:hypothetical protein